MRFFSKSPVLHPDDLRKLKVFSGSAAPPRMTCGKRAGSARCPWKPTGIPQGLLSGTISAVPTVPIFALAAQLDSQAKYMLESNWGPLAGAAVVQKKTWDRVPAGAREAMLKIAEETGPPGQSRRAGRERCRRGGDGQARAGGAEGDAGSGSRMGARSLTRCRTKSAARSCRRTCLMKRNGC